MLIYNEPERNHKKNITIFHFTGISAIIEHEFYRFYYFYIVKRKCFHRLQKAAGSMISVI